MPSGSLSRRRLEFAHSCHEIFSTRSRLRSSTVSRKTEQWCRTIEAIRRKSGAQLPGVHVVLGVSTQFLVSLAPESVLNSRVSQPECCKRRSCERIISPADSAFGQNQ